MSVYMCNVAKDMSNDNRLVQLPYSDLVYGLYTNLPVLSPATVLADLTEMVGTGYARSPMTPFGASALQPSDHALANGSPVSFTNTGGSPWPQANGFFFFSPGAGFIVHVGDLTPTFILAGGETKIIIPQAQLTGDDVP